MTRLFKRREDTTVTELEDYYSGRSRRKTIKAWIMAILYIFITVLIILALFYGARFVYRSLADDNSENNTNSGLNASNTENSGLPTFDGEAPGSQNQSDGTSNTNDSVVETGGVVTDQAATTSNGNATTITQPGNVNSNIPDTGAGEALIIIPFIVGIAGYTISRKQLLKSSR